MQETRRPRRKGRDGAGEGPRACLNGRAGRFGRPGGLAGREGTAVLEAQRSRGTRRNGRSEGREVSPDEVGTVAGRPGGLRDGVAALFGRPFGFPAHRFVG